MNPEIFEIRNCLFVTNGTNILEVIENTRRNERFQGKTLIIQNSEEFVRNAVKQYAEGNLFISDCLIFLHDGLSQHTVEKQVRDALIAYETYKNI